MHSKNWVFFFLKKKTVHVESSNSGFVKVKSIHEHEHEQMNFVNISFIFSFFSVLDHLQVHTSLIPIFQRMGFLHCLMGKGTRIVQPDIVVHYSGYFDSLSSGSGLESSDLDSKDCWLEVEEVDWIGFLNCTMIMVMLSHPSPPAVDGAKHLSSTLSHTAEILLSCIDYGISIAHS